MGLVPTRGRTPFWVRPEGRNHRYAAGQRVGELNMAETETFLINGRTLDTLTLEQLDALRALVIEEIDRRTVAP